MTDHNCQYTEKLGEMKATLKNHSDDIKLMKEQSTAIISDNSCLKNQLQNGHNEFTRIRTDITEFKKDIKEEVEKLRDFISMKISAFEVALAQQPTVKTLAVMFSVISIATGALVVFATYIMNISSK